MRRRTSDPLHMTHVVSHAGWEQMRWEGLERMAPDWRVYTIDTTHMAAGAVADAVLGRCWSVLAGTARPCEFQTSERRQPAFRSHAAAPKRK
jgi:hypothetical protein